MVRYAIPANNASKGVLDPLLHDRVDLDQRKHALLDGLNAFVLPQGGFRFRGGTIKRSKLRRPLRRFELSAGMITAPNGGTIADLIDGDEATLFTTTSDATSADFIVFSVDLGETVELEAVDVYKFKIAAGAFDAAIGIEVSEDGVAWSSFGDAFNIRTTPRTRRWSDPPGTASSVRYLRLVVDGGSGGGAISCGELRVFKRTARAGNIRRFNFTFDDTQTYILIATDRNIDVFRRGVFQASVAIPHRSDQLPSVTIAQRSDVMLLFHEEVPVTTLFRQGAHDEWDVSQQDFTNVPSLASGTTFGAAQDEVQRVSVFGLAVAADFTLSAEDQETAAIARDANDATLAADIEAALEALPNVGDGIEVDVVSSDATSVIFDIRFGGDNGDRSWPRLFVDVLANDDATFDVDVLQDGRASSGALMSKETGWPRCGTFHQSRLMCGGFKLRPETLIGSVLADFFNFDQDVALEAAAGLEFSLDSDDVATIRHIFAARHLQVFADTSEWWISDRVLDATQPLTFVQSTRFGVREGIAPLQVEGSTIFVQDSGDTVRDFEYSDVAQDYEANVLSLLGGHLITNVVDASYRRATNTTEGSQVFIANDDGTLAVMMLMKNENVRAMTKFNTPGGKLVTAAVDAERTVYFITERDGEGYIEEYSEEVTLDAAVLGSFEVPSNVISGLDHIEGQTVWVIADGGQPMGPYVVEGGEVTLEENISSYECGLLCEVAVSPMPPRIVGRDGTLLMTALRIHTVTLSLFETTAVAVQANGSRVREVPLLSFNDEAAYLPPLLQSFTGEKRIVGLTGRKRDATCVVTRIGPARVNCRAIYLEVA